MSGKEMGTTTSEPPVAIVHWECFPAGQMSPADPHFCPEFDGCLTRHVILWCCTWSRPGIPRVVLPSHGAGEPGALIHTASNHESGATCGASEREHVAEAATTTEGNECHANDTGNCANNAAGSPAFCALELNVIEDVHSSGPGGRIWDAAVVLAEFIACRFGNASIDGDLGGRQRGGMSGLEVLELGAGTGIAGMVCAKLGARVAITDKDFVVPLITANAQRNAPEQVAHGQVWGQALSWGQKLPKYLKRNALDLIVASDVVGCGDQALYPPLIKTLVDLSVPSNAPILMTYKPRAAFETHFFAAARQHFMGKFPSSLHPSSCPPILSFSSDWFSFSGIEASEALMDGLRVLWHESGLTGRTRHEQTYPVWSKTESRLYDSMPGSSVLALMHIPGPCVSTT
jgi:hypothetical protein